MNLESMWLLVLLFSTTGCALMAIRSPQLLASALWLAGASVLTAILLYALGAPSVAVLELSVGAGLVTILFVFAIQFEEQKVPSLPPPLPRLIAWGLPVLALIIIGLLIVPLPVRDGAQTESASFAVTLWGTRVLDTLVQVGLIFAGTLGVLGILAERRRPITELEDAQHSAQPELNPVPSPMPFIVEPSEESQEPVCPPL